MLRFSCEGTVLNYGVTVANEFEVQKKFELKILRFPSRYGLLTGSQVVLHWTPVLNMMMASITTVEYLPSFLFSHARI